jgi:hypothetical protein
MCHVIKKGHGILNVWLLFNYIITNGTLTHDQLQGSWKQVEKMLKIIQNLCKLVEM